MIDRYPVALLGNILFQAENLGLIDKVNLSDKADVAEKTRKAYRLLWDTHEPRLKERMYYVFNQKWCRFVDKRSLVDYLPDDSDIGYISANYRSARWNFRVHGIVADFVERIGGVEKLPAYGFPPNDTRVLDELYYERPLAYVSPAMNGAFMLTSGIDPVTEHDRWCGLFWLVVKSVCYRETSRAGAQLGFDSLSEAFEA